jgi:DNA (cytosine-5)-methyltransferase 1
LLQERFKKYLEKNKDRIFAMRQRDRHNRNEEKGQVLEQRKDECSNTITTVQKDNLIFDRKGFDSRTKGFRVSDICPTLSRKMGTGGNNVPMVIANCLDANMSKGISPKLFYEKHKRNIIEDNKLLRRLTPLECFRLMGFLNDEINLDNLSDTQRYKLAGNGWDINVVSKIFKELFKPSYQLDQTC